MPIDQVSTSEYMRQSRDTRDALRAIFGLPRTGKTETVVDATGKGICVSDGTTFKDLEVLTFDKMLTYLGESTAEDNVHSLFNKVITKIEIVPVPIEEAKFPEQQPLPLEPVKEEVKPEETVIVTPEGLTKTKCAFCEFQTASKIAMKMHVGRFHKYNK